jgi:hypothetical protein
VVNVPDLPNFEAFVREGVKGGYRAEWYPSESAPFLGLEKFVPRVVKRRERSLLRRHPPLLEVLWREAAGHAELSLEAVRSGEQSVRVVEARDGFIQRAVFAAGYRATTVAAVVGCPAANVSRALQRR